MFSFDLFYLILASENYKSTLNFKKMKKLSIFLLSAIALGSTVTSCSKDEAAPTIVAKWQFNTMQGTEGSTTYAAGTKEAIWSDGGCTSNVAYWQFDNAAGLHYGFYDSTSSCQLKTADVNYSVDAKNTKITITTSKGSVDYPIVKLTATELSWRESGTGQDADGNPVAYNLVHNMVKK